MVVEQLAEGYKRCVIHRLPEAPACNMDKNPTVILLIKIFTLKDCMLFLNFLKCLPLLFERLKIDGCSALNCLVFEQIQLFFIPKQSNIYIFGHMLHHFIKNVVGCFGADQEQAVSQ